MLLDNEIIKTSDRLERCDVLIYIIMFDALTKYINNDHFFFSASNNLEEVCNAPKFNGGVYLVYALKNGKIELVYIGSSGKMRQNGELKIRKNGLYDRLVNGKQFDAPRKQSWKDKLKEENIDALDIYWFVTFDEVNNDIPQYVEGLIIQSYYDLHKKLPLWNKEY